MVTETCRPVHTGAALRADTVPDVSSYTASAAFIRQNRGPVKNIELLRKKFNSDAVLFRQD